MLLPRDAAPGIYLLWIPLGAGGSGVVRGSGRLYERLVAMWQGRRPKDLYHTALIVRIGAVEHVVETMWPSPAGDPATRGVVVRAPVFSPLVGRLRMFTYEVRSWSDGTLADADQAWGGPQLLRSRPDAPPRLLSLVPQVPPLVWGRDQRGLGEMWNSNSVISWLLVSTGLSMADVRPPTGGRAPGWDAGIALAESALVT